MDDLLKNFPKIIFRNFGYKVVSLLAAIALWSGFVGRGEYVLDVELGINYLLPAHFTLHNPPEILKAKLKGPEMAMKKYSRHNKAVTVDLVGIPPGENQIAVTRKLLDIPPGVQILSVKPEIISLKMIRSDGASGNGN